MRVLVVGAGVTGLTCAVVLAERGHDVHVVARDLPMETASAAMPGCWYPGPAPSHEHAVRWARATYDALATIARQDGPVRMRTCRELVGSAQPEPWWVDACPARRHRMHPVPAGYHDGWVFDMPVVNAADYLQYLQQRLEATGATLTRMALGTLPSGADAVLNATSLGSRVLAGDENLQPVRIQHTVVSREFSQGSVSDVTIDAAGQTYVVPAAEGIAVGYDRRRNDWMLAADTAVAEQMLARACNLVPRLAEAPVVGHQVGLVGARGGVRLETERRNGSSLVVHCYGHGEAGLALSWGCAEDAAQVLEQEVSPAEAPTVR